MSDSERVTARTVRTTTGQVYTEYRLGVGGYRSIGARRTDLEER